MIQSARENNSIMAPIWFWREFETPYGFLSQWYSCNFIHDGQEFTSAEQWMMWSKAKLFDDEESAKKILGEWSSTLPSLAIQIKSDLGLL